MHRPGVRFTIRQLMIAIAIVGLWLVPIVEEERYRRASDFFKSVATYHESRTVAATACSRTMRCGFRDPRGEIMTSAEVRAIAWHKQLAEKYSHAAAHPWLPVESDLPPP